MPQSLPRPSRPVKNDVTKRIPYDKMLLRMKEAPGYLKPIYRATEWLDLVYRSDLDSTTKLVASVISRSSSYNKQKQLQLTNISDYSISRVIKENQEEVRERTELLMENGWIFDTGIRRGSRKVYALTFSVKPLGKMRQ